MIAYLNGLGKPKRKPFGGKGKKALTKLKATGKTLNEKRKALDKKIIAKHKQLAKKVGAGIKRIAKIQKNIAVKSTLKALEKNLMGFSSRLKLAYQKEPNAVKMLFKPFGDFEQFKNAINKGDKKLPAIIGGIGEETGNEAQAEQVAEATKQGIGIIKQIAEWFKKRKESKKGDAETVEAMENSVDADPNIEKTDENGVKLPVTEEAKEITKQDEKEGAEAEKEEGGIMSNKPLLIGGIAVAVIGAYFLMKKK